ncbi:LysE family translocator [Bartonella ancashensis]|uniref:Amino acid efflux protein n=1 Tax=Bartonella ancashensis TaxID=1318743 RepID=A0A0M3T2T3_9HYPH|nr:LysE family translocator [Bartonella ancashensis]ALE03285.1 Amino acid efflux protein [Bartonella ancashensis]
MSFLPEWAVFIKFSLIALILALTPGPDVILSIERSIVQNKKAGIMCVLGSSTGFAIQVFSVSLGLSALILTSPKTFFLLKITGAFYLLWLAFKMVRTHPTLSLNNSSQKRKSLKSNYLAAVGISLLNPKAVLFNVTFLPQFINANDPMATQKLLILGLSYIPISLPITISIVFMANKLSTLLQQKPSYMRVFHWLVAVIFASFAIRLLIDKTF